MIWALSHPQWPMWLRLLTHRIGLDQHWFRLDWREMATEAEAMNLPCVYGGCGRPGVEHWRWSGEWMLPFRERWSRSLTRLKTVIWR
jgi:hypothetical protein